MLINPNYIKKHKYKALIFLKQIKKNVEYAIMDMS